MLRPASRYGGSAWHVSSPAGHFAPGAGGGTIKLDVEAIDAGLSDVSGEWAALGRPEHETDS
jgi:hypothetical protein